MTSHITIGLALMLAPMILIASIAIGVFGFKPERVQALRRAEADSGSTVVEEVRHIVIGRSERFRRGRIDRHPMYLGLHLAAWGYSWCVFGGAPLTSNVVAMSESSRVSMAACFLVGSTLALTGAAMGMSVFGHVFLRGVRDNMTSSRLGDDIQLPYTFGMAAMVAMAVSFGVYSVTSFHSTVGSLGGWLTGSGAMSCVVMLGVYYFRMRQFGRVRPQLIAQAVERIERRNACE
jgi:protein-S-isoprenylcysteine O-methyltransferase Ste14